MRIRDACIVAALTAAFALPGLPAVVAALTRPVEPPAAVAPGPLATRSLDLVTASGRHRFTVEVADDDASRAYGLMNRTSLSDDRGMLFDFGVERQVAFWMRNTLIPLDMVFVRADGSVANVRERAVPHDEGRIPSAGPVRYVLEVPAGVAAAIGARPGDRLALVGP